MELPIGAVIARTRRAKGMTQEALADAVGVSAAAVSKWETAASYPDITLLPPLARALGTTIDGLLDFREAPTDEEMRAITGRLRQIFDEQGFSAGKEAAEALIREYPSSGALKLVAAAHYYRFLASALNEAGDAEQAMRAVTERCLTLFEQGEQQADTPGEALIARSLHANALILLGRCEDAEAIIDALPPRAMVDADVLRLNLLLAQQRLDEAEPLAGRALLTHMGEVSTALMQRITIARRRGDSAAAHRFADAFCALDALFGLDRSNGIQLQQTLALEEGDTARALDLFEQYVDARLAYTLDYRNNPFFGGVQTAVPTANQLAEHNRLAVRAIEEDGSLAPLRAEPRFGAALERLRASLPPEG